MWLEITYDIQPISCWTPFDTRTPWNLGYDTRVNVLKLMFLVMASRATFVILKSNRTSAKVLD